MERKYSRMHPRSSLKLLDATNKLVRCPTTTLTINTSFSLAVSSSSRLDRFIWSMAISSSWLLFSLSLSDPCNFFICSFIYSSCLSAKLALYIDSNKFSKFLLTIFIKIGWISHAIVRGVRYLRKLKNNILFWKSSKIIFILKIFKNNISFWKSSKIIFYSENLQFSWWKVGNHVKWMQIIFYKFQRGHTFAIKYFLRKTQPRY